MSKTKPDKYALVTGCSEGGIGPSLAGALLKTGKYHVFATARTISKIPAHLRDAEEVTTLTLDVASEKDVARVVEEVSARTGGRLDVLVNNSGIGDTGLPILEIPLERAKYMFNVNYFGPLAMVQAFAPMLVKYKGAVVNNSSIAGEKSMMFNGVYGSTKAALTHLGNTLRLELEALGIRVITVATGAVVSYGLKNQVHFKLDGSSFYAPVADKLEGIPASVAKINGMHPDEYARQVVRALESGVNGKIFRGNLVPLFKYITWWMPDSVWNFINRQQYPYVKELKTATDKWRVENLR